VRRLETKALERAIAHPLEPLTAEEIRAAARVVRSSRSLPDRARFVEVTLREPAKEAVLRGDPDLDRQASVSVLDPQTGVLEEGAVSLRDGAVVSWREVPGALPPILPDEFPAMVEALKADAAYCDALRRRGIEDLELVSIDAIPAGHWGNPEDELGRRFVRALSFVRPEPGGSSYARPVEGLVAFVDLNRMEVFRVDDRITVPLPPDEGEYRAERIGARADLRPLEIEQPGGPSFELEGHELRWQRWRLRIGFTPREGLVLHDLRYDDEGHERRVLYRASYTELAVPYGHPSPEHYHQCVLDLGEQQFGALANSLELGCDCLGEIRYLDAVVNDSRGEPVVLRNAICIHEEDQGILWKHVDVRAGHTEVRRRRRLVVSWVATTGNYEYGFFWYLHQDGTVESEVKLTGILQTAALTDGAAAEYGELVAPRVNGMNHQHIFNVRLDLDVDGSDNSVYEIDSDALRLAETNPWGNAFVTRSTLLETESAAQRLVDPFRARFWKIVSASSRNALGQARGYKLVPGTNTVPLYAPESGFGERTGFTRYHLWVTPFDPGERYATGDYPVQNAAAGGLPEWTRANRSIVGTDVVVWYTFVHHHVPRPEDWPVMPVATIGFALTPAGFFDRNPALDVPAPHRCHPG
jgi:primary-amine oxidase